MTPQVNSRNSCLNKWILFRILRTTRVFSFVLTFVCAAITTKNGGVMGRQENTKFLPAAALLTGKQFVFWCLISSSAVNLCRVHDVTYTSAWRSCVWATSYSPFQLVPTLLGLAPLGGSVWYQAVSLGSRQSELSWKYDMRATPSKRLKLHFFFFKPNEGNGSTKPNTMVSESGGKKKL